MVNNKIIQMIEKIKILSITVTKDSNLYKDLGIDSLSFIRLLIQIEETYSINFDIKEMELCLNVGTLISIVENKIKECNCE